MKRFGVIWMLCILCTCLLPGCAKVSGDTYPEENRDENNPIIEEMTEESKKEPADPIKADWQIYLENLKAENILDVDSGSQRISLNLLVAILKNAASHPVQHPEFQSYLWSVSVEIQEDHDSSSYLYLTAGVEENIVELSGIVVRSVDSRRVYYHVEDEILYWLIRSSDDDMDAYVDKKSYNLYKEYVDDYISSWENLGVSWRLTDFHINQNSEDWNVSIYNVKWGYVWDTDIPFDDMSTGMRKLLAFGLFDSNMYCYPHEDDFESFAYFVVVDGNPIGFLGDYDLWQSDVSVELKHYSTKEEFISKISPRLLSAHE